MIRSLRCSIATATLILALAQPSHAVTGSRTAPSETIARAIVTVVAAGGGVCTGTLITPTIVLTAAHCIAPGSANRVIDYSTKPPQLVTPQRVATHPQYNTQSISAHRATADVSLLRLPAPLMVTGQPGTLQIRLMDPQTQNRSAGMGACTGDSGAPAFEDRNGVSVVVGVVSWSTAANNAAGCGGLTGVTPLTLYRDWILKTARSWGAPL